MRFMEAFNVWWSTFRNCVLPQLQPGDVMQLGGGKWTMSSVQPWKLLLPVLRVRPLVSDHIHSFWGLHFPTVLMTLITGKSHYSALEHRNAQHHSERQADNHSVNSPQQVESSGNAVSVGIVPSGIVHLGVWLRLVYLLSRRSNRLVITLAALVQMWDEPWSLVGHDIVLITHLQHF